MTLFNALSASLEQNREAALRHLNSKVQEAGTEFGYLFLAHQAEAGLTPAQAQNGDNAKAQEAGTAFGQLFLAPEAGLKAAQAPRQEQNDDTPASRHRSAA